MLKKFFKIFVPAVYSGLCIGIGGMVYLNCENKVVGAFMFCIGLLTILLFGFNLYTGKVGYTARISRLILDRLLLCGLAILREQR